LSKPNNQKLYLVYCRPVQTRYTWPAHLFEGFTSSLPRWESDRNGTYMKTLSAT